MFTDEVTITSSVQSTWHRRQWVGRGEAVLSRPKDRLYEKVSVWIAFGCKRRALRILRTPPNITRQRFISEVLEPEISFFRAADRAGYTIQQDNARIHSEAWFERNNIRHLAGWPSLSPDLNPVEQINAILKNRVAARCPWGQEELIATIKEEFANIADSTFVKLHDSFRDRMKAVLESGGNTVML